jgi:hypothetical protein
MMLATTATAVTTVTGGTRTAVSMVVAADREAGGLVEEQLR